MIEYPLTGAKLISLIKITYGDDIIEQGEVVEIDKVGFIEEYMKINSFSGIAFTIKEFSKNVGFPVESPNFEELNDNMYEDEIINWQ